VLRTRVISALVLAPIILAIVLLGEPWLSLLVGVAAFLALVELVGLLDTAGHTPGHVSIEVAGGEGLIIGADAAVNPFVFFEHPEWRFSFDAIPELAVANRRKLLDRAAADKIKLIGFHWKYPGVGYAEPKDNAYRFVPAG